MKFVYPEGATPFNQDDLQNLIPVHLKIQRELDEWEQANIIQAELWLLSKKSKLLTTLFCKKLHQKMFDQTWKWAGKFRTHQTNIGVAPYQIHQELESLWNDLNFQRKAKIYSVDELAARFHHRLVKIHAFPNGNGRHARLMTDALLVNMNQPKFSWGKGNLVNAGETRKQYIKSLQQADQYEYTELLKFVRG